jgi:acetyltransferase-like isoleucine patch superfamily enzyme
MIGEYTSVRDTSHNYSSQGVPFMEQKDISQPIRIGNNVWIGRGCIIFPGTIIEDGVIVGSNSIVKGHLKANSIYAGAPLKLITQILVPDESGTSPTLL